VNIVFFSRFGGTVGIHHHFVSLAFCYLIFSKTKSEVTTKDISCFVFLFFSTFHFPFEKYVINDWLSNLFIPSSIYTISEKKTCTRQSSNFDSVFNLKKVNIHVAFHFSFSLLFYMSSLIHVYVVLIRQVYSFFFFSSLFKTKKKSRCGYNRKRTKRIFETFFFVVIVVLILK